MAAAGASPRRAAPACCSPGEHGRLPRCRRGGEVERTVAHRLRGGPMRRFRRRGEENMRSRMFAKAAPSTSGLSCARDSGWVPRRLPSGVPQYYALPSQVSSQPMSRTGPAGMPPTSRSLRPNSASHPPRPVSRTPAGRPSACLRPGVRPVGSPGAPRALPAISGVAHASLVLAESEAGQTRAMQPQRIVLDRTSSRSAAMVPGTGRSRAPVPSARPRTGFRVCPTRMSSMLP